MSETLIVNEIFKSIQGESTRAGLPCVMVRLAGCNLRCAWCDTVYAQDAAAGRAMSVDDVLARAGELGCPRAEVTGGEPLLQPAAASLLGRLCDAGFETLLETNGSQDIAAVDPRVVRIVDFKCPSSGADAANRWENVEHLTARDEVKFVIADRRDYEYARDAAARYGLRDRCAVIFSPANLAAPADLARWILEDGLDVRLGLQVHKMIWPERDRGV